MSESYDLASLLEKRGEEIAAEQTDSSLKNSSSPIKQLNGTLAQSEGEVILNETKTGTEPPPFFGVDSGKGPQYTLKQEKAHHRVIIYALAEGKTAGEIADEFGFTPQMVYYVEKQPWAKAQVAKLIQQHGGDAVEKTLKGAALDAAEVLVRMKDDSNAPHAVRVNAAKEILDRIYGKSQQIINHRRLEASELTDDELAKLATSRTGSQ